MWLLNHPKLNTYLSELINTKLASISNCNGRNGQSCWLGWPRIPCPPKKSPKMHHTPISAECENINHLLEFTLYSSIIWQLGQVDQMTTWTFEWEMSPVLISNHLCTSSKQRKNKQGAKVSLFSPKIFIN